MEPTLVCSFFQHLDLDAATVGALRRNHRPAGLKSKTCYFFLEFRRMTEVFFTFTIVS